MSAQTLALPEQNAATPLAVSFKFLLSLYAIVPLCLLVQLTDQFLWGFRLKELLPNSPSHFLLFQILFGTPHIIASNLLLVNQAEYLQTFKTKLLGMTLFIVLFFGLGSLVIPYRWLYVITACWTVYHVLKQQHGIAKAVCRLPVRAFYVQLWLSIVAGIFIYLGIFLKNGLTAAESSSIFQIASGFSVALLISTMIYQAQVPNRFGKYFLWANTLLVLASWYLYAQQYYFLAILMPRLVHDICAYTFYVCHDVNRYGKQADAGLYRWVRSCQLPVALVLPLLSFGLTFLLQVYGDEMVNFISQTLFATTIYKAVTLGLIGYLALMHYYTEAFVWSVGSPLRRYIVFAK